MDDYISREQAINVFKTFYGKSLRTMLDALEEEPAADVVPVVRCRDCKHYEIYQLKSDYTDDLRYKPSVCTIGQYAVRRSPDWFCAYGNRPHCGADMRGGAEND